ncbi:Cytokinin riboside 5'-monophosphate phosphoribohydrolase LOG protein [Dioscorea alata]|uniref:Cytokinin riboside 5'-monophosphate phosphoribohydrolase LOG protein n=1 Tax=Dioscorea alata TaxID=55571 RepID=A0ACB7UDB8_DIOAL|nr:Cytokinin riboside 5'-monophosphate phosphoribohydrolase LOG protein [Dioscorea alata]
MEGDKERISTSKFKTICIFCDSSLEKKKSYHDVAIDLAKELVMKNIDLVYGGGNIGLMGLIAQTVFDDGRHVLGYELKPVVNMHQRKSEMNLHSDAFIAMPGGYGTLDELFKVITWVQLGIHNKPIGLLNIDGYYDSLLSFIDQIIEEGFIKPSTHHIIVSASNAKELIEKLEVICFTFSPLFFHCLELGMRTWTTFGHV